MSQSDNDELVELLAQTRVGNKRAFAQLYERTSSHLYALTLRILRDESLAQEAVQDAYIQIWQKAQTYNESRGGARTWMGSIARYRALDLLRSRKRLDVMAEPPEPEAIDPSGTWLDQTDLQRCWPELSDEQRQAVALSFINGYSHAELAERLDAPLGTVKSWVRRGLMALKTCLEGLKA